MKNELTPAEKSRVEEGIKLLEAALKPAQPADTLEQVEPAKDSCTILAGEATDEPKPRAPFEQLRVYSSRKKTGARDAIFYLYDYIKGAAYCEYLAFKEQQDWYLSNPYYMPPIYYASKAVAELIKDIYELNENIKRDMERWRVFPIECFKSYVSGNTFEGLFHLNPVEFNRLIDEFMNTDSSQMTEQMVKSQTKQIVVYYDILNYHFNFLNNRALSQMFDDFASNPALYQESLGLIEGLFENIFVFWERRGDVAFEPVEKRFTEKFFIENRLLPDWAFA